MRTELPPEGPSMDAALLAWHRKATDVLLIASAAGHLLPVILMVAGYGPRMTPWFRATGLTCYTVMVASAVLLSVDWRMRLGAYFVAAYSTVALASVSPVQGPYASVGLVAQPILALVLCAPIVARVAVAASAVILVSAPFVRVLPSVAGALIVGATPPAVPPVVVWFQTVGLGAFLATLFVLLDRFHRFLLDTLAAQYQARADLRREAFERHRLEREVTAIGDEERRRLGRDLHDGVCQELTAALLRWQTLQRSLKEGGPVSAAESERLTSLLTEAIDDAHNVALGLCPVEPEPDALAPALRALARRMQETAGVHCEFLATGDVRVPDSEMAQHLYRIAQEALSNAVRHAHATRIAVELRGDTGGVALQVEDDGVGLPPDGASGGMGLRTMAYRAQVLGGQLTVAPAPGGGTRVACRLPRPVPSPAGPGRSGDEPWIPA
jgi:signal transduction histidine kinase